MAQVFSPRHRESTGTCKRRVTPLRVLINEPRVQRRPLTRLTFGSLDSTPSIFNHKESLSASPPRLSPLSFLLRSRSPAIYTYLRSLPVSSIIRMSVPTLVVVHLSQCATVSSFADKSERNSIVIFVETRSFDIAPFDFPQESHVRLKVKPEGSSFSEAFAIRFCSGRSAVRRCVSLSNVKCRCADGARDRRLTI